MNIFVDENIPNVTVETLRELGHDVLDFRGTSNEGADDEELWPMVQSQGRLLISTDKGFTAKREEPHHGMILNRHEKVFRHPGSARAPRVGSGALARVHPVGAPAGARGAGSVRSPEQNAALLRRAHLVRLRQPNSPKIHDRVMRAFTGFREEEWPGLLVVMRDSVQSVSRVA